MRTVLLEARNIVCRTIEGRRLVDDVTLKVEAGDRLAIIGPNGAGKTTLLRALAGVAQPTSGDIRIEGRLLHELSPVERARRIAVVGQTDRPDPRLAVIDYVEIGRVPHFGIRKKSEERDLVVEALKRTELYDMSARPIGSLSGGERQRAQIARAIVQEPKILFLDEPTNHLDPRARCQILELVAELEITVVAVLHDLPLVTPFSTHVGVMKDGHLVGFDTPARTLTPTLVRDVFSVDILRLPHPEEDRELTIFDIPTRLSVNL